ncbi:MAG: DUF4190 domain-containing protein [Mariniblastus sp.]|nr:DUF4190 domain-containing protein [Mariniblastus sp.]
MPESPKSSFNYPMQMSPLPEKDENPVGLTGFIISVIGLFLCGIPSIIGLLISAIGLRKAPRGFAIAGLLISFLGLVELLALGFLAYSTYRLADDGVRTFKNLAVNQLLEIEANSIGREWEKLERVPTQQEGDDLIAGKRDINGNSIAYETDGSSFSLRAAGNDGKLQTEDDVVAGPFEDIESTLMHQLTIEPDDPDWDQEFEKFNNENMNF